MFSVVCPSAQKFSDLVHAYSKMMIEQLRLFEEFGQSEVNNIVILSDVVYIQNIFCTKLLYLRAHYITGSGT